MTKYIVGMSGAVLGLLGGLWMMIAPFAHGYQPSGAGWVGATVNDFWFGCGLVLVSAAGFALYGRLLLEDLGKKGIVERKATVHKRQEAAADTDQGSSGGDPAVEQTLVPLLSEMLADMQRQREGHNGGEPVGNVGQRPETGEQRREHERSEQR